MKIEKIVKPKQNIVSIQTNVPVEKLPEIIGPSFMKLATYIKENNANILSNPYISYRNLKEDGQVNNNLVEVEVGFPVDKLIDESDDIRSYVLPSYKAMTKIFKGSYEDLTNPYIELLEHIKNENGTFTGVSYEYYLSDEEIPSDQHETIIEVVYKVE